ncbi:hypothetical protein [Rhodococcus sp. 24CO]|uniref:hypothetical protein n=1 Tax=Rhodococcus sp. 24CO TaxID=3117460 RepID=UPI003D347633
MIWILVVVLASGFGTLAVRRLLTGKRTAGTALTVVGSVLLIAAAAVEIITEPTDVTGTASLSLTFLGGAASLTAMTLDNRERSRKNV